MKKSNAFSALALLFMLSASAWCGEIGPVAVAEAGSDDTAASETPAAYAVDGEAGTSWVLPASLAGGRIELRLSADTLVSGIELEGNFPAGSAVRIGFLDSAGAERFFAGGYSAEPDATTSFDLSYERAVASVLFVELSKPAGAQVSIRELRVLGENASEQRRLLAPESVESGETTSAFYPADYLFDGSPWTEWRSSRLGVFSGVPRDVDRRFDEWDSKRKRTTESWGKASAIARLGGQRNIDSIRVYVSEDLNGNAELSAGLAGAWTTVAHIDRSASPGWYDFPLNGIAADAIRVEQSGNMWGIASGIAEIEIRGSGTFAGDAYAPIGVAGPFAFTVPQNYSFEWSDADRGAVLEFGVSAAPSGDLSVDFNGSSKILQRSSTAGNTAIYRLEIASHELWQGTNFIRLRPRASADELRFVRLRTASGREPVSIVGSSAASDGNILTPGGIVSETILALDGAAKLKGIEIFSLNGIFPDLYVPEGQGWKRVVLTARSGMNASYAYDGEADRLKVVPNGARISEVRVSGSPLRSRAPSVKLLSPESIPSSIPFLSNDDYFIGFVDNPECSVTVNGIHVPTFGHYFWTTPALVGAHDDEPLDLAIVARDRQGRSDTCSLTLLVGDSPFIQMDAADAVHYSASATWPVSGSVRLPQTSVTINGNAASMSGRRFAGTAALEEGFNLVTVAAAQARSGRVIGIEQRKVVRVSAPLTIQASRPADGSYTRQSSLTVSGRVLGAGAVTVTVSGKACTVQGAEFKSPVLDLSEGKNTFVIEARDSMDRWATASLVVNRDTVKPVVSIQAPAEGAYIASSSVAVSGTIADASPTTVYVDGKAVAHSGASFSATLRFADGSRSVSVRPVDAAGNIGETAKIQFTVDTVPPNEFAVSADPSGWTSETRPTISFNATDATSGIARYEVSIDGENWTVAASPYRLPSLSDGARKIFVRAADRAGNVRIAVTTVYIDTAAPSAAPGFKAIPGNALMQLVWDSPAEDVSYYRLTRTPAFDSGPVEVSGEEYFDRTTTVGISYSYDIVAVDRAGNESAASTDAGLCGLATEAYSPTAGCVVEYHNVAVTVPPDTFGQDVAKVAVSEIQSEELLDRASNPIVGPMYDISAVAGANGADTFLESVSFDTKVVVKIDYDPALLESPAAEEGLRVFYYDPNWSRWFKMDDSAVDLEHHAVYFLTDHFTVFSVQASPAVDLSPQELAEAPYSPMGGSAKHERFSVSPQGGGASTAMTELVLPGPNGFDFALRRVYDSGTARRDTGLFSNLLTHLKLEESTIDFPIGCAALLERIKSGSLTDADKKVLNQIEESVEDDGDHPYMLGIGWRLDLPYIRLDGADFVLRAPGGGEHSINYVLKRVEKRSTPGGRELIFECHEGEDFTLIAEQDNDGKKHSLFRSWTDWDLIGWRLVTKDGTAYHFKKDGRLTSITDPSGKFTVTVEYDDHKITKITDSRGRELSLVYRSGFGVNYIKEIRFNGGKIKYDTDPTGKLTSATDLAGRTYSYTYASPLVLSSLSTAAKNKYKEEGTLHEHRSTEYISLLEKIEGPGIGAETITYTPSKQSNGTAETVSWRIPASSISISVAGAPVKTTNCTYVFNLQGNNQYIVTNAVVTDGRSNTLYHYEPFEKKRKKKISYDEFTDSDGDAKSSTKKTEYIPKLTKKIVKNAAETVLETTTYGYDDTTMRKISETTSGADETTRTLARAFAYDAWGNVISETTTTTVDGATVKREVLTDYIAGGDPSSGIDSATGLFSGITPSSIPEFTHGLFYRRLERSTDASGIVSYKYRYARYDSLGRMTRDSRYRDGSWYSTYYAYDESANEISKITAPDGHVTDFSYSTAGSTRTVTRIEQDVVQADGTTRDIVSKTGFSTATGLKISEKDGRGYTTSWTYDAIGRVRSVTRPDAGDGAPYTSVSYDDSKLTVTVTDPLSAAVTYDFDGLGRLVQIDKTLRPRTPLGAIVPGTASTLTTKAAYNGWDQVTSITDPRNKTTSYEYDATGRLAKVAHPDGAARTMAFDYATGVLTTTDERGYAATERYDLEDKLLSRKRNDAVREIAETFAYDGFGRRLSQTLSSDGRIDATSFSYNEADALVRKTTPAATFFENGKEVAVAPVLQYEYDAAGRLSAEIAAGPSGDLRTDYLNDGLGRRYRTASRYTTVENGVPVVKTAAILIYYDDAGNKVRETDANGKTSEWTYNPRGKAATARTPAGAVTRYAYDKNDRLLTMTDPRGAALAEPAFSIDYRYDDIGRLVAGILPLQDGARPSVLLSYDPRGNLIRRTESDGGTIDYAYDDRNRLLTETATAAYGDGSWATFTTTRTYDPAGNETTVTDGAGGQTVKQYDPLGRLVEVRDPEFAVETYAYDGYGNRTALTDGRGNTTRNTYDSYGRLTATVDPEGASSRSAYDRLGRITRAVDPLGHAIDFGYDELSRLVEERRADGAVRTYTYDGVGNMLSALDPRGTATAYAYDDDYRLTSATRTNAGVTEFSAYTYDSAGDRVTATENGVAAAYNTVNGIYTPDPYGRVRALSRSVGGRALTLGYDYDSVGRTTEITYAGGRAVAYDYDTSGRLETVPGYLSGRVSYDAAGRVSSLTAANGVRTTAERDLLGRLKELDYSGTVDVASFSLSYDSAGNIVRKNDSSYTYDRANRLEAANERGRFANDRIAELDDLGKREGDTDGEGELAFTSEQTEVLFDYGSMSIGVDLGAAFEVSRVTLDPRATGHRVKAERYEILVAANNAEGNWTRVQGAVAEVLPSGAILTRFKEPVEARYIKLHCYYDDLGADGKPVDKATVRNPLVTVGYFERNRDEDYEYDAKGNRKRVTTVFAGNTTSSSYTYYPNTDRIRTDGKYAYVYDPNGNMIEKGTAFEDTGSEIKFFDNEGEYFKYEYDLSNRLVRVLRSDAGTANAAVRSSYRYGPDGLRISKTTASGTTYYVYGLDGNELSEISDEAQTDTVWVLGKKFAEETTIGAATTRTYLATDHLGSVVAATDETGKVIWQGSLTAFGEDGGEAGLKDRVRSYAGKDWDEDAGLVYNNARWYDPRIARFTTEDPARDGVNWYAYVNNRPLNATDPTGLESGETTWEETIDGTTYTHTTTTFNGITTTRTTTTSSGTDSSDDSGTSQPRDQGAQDADNARAEAAARASGRDDTPATPDAGPEPREDGRSGQGSDSIRENVLKAFERSDAFLDDVCYAVWGNDSATTYKVAMLFTGYLYAEQLALSAGNSAIRFFVNSRVVVGGETTVIAGSNIRHINGAIGEAHGYADALRLGQKGIQAPGKVTAAGPDFITFDPSTGRIIVWDSKYSSTGRFPNSAKGFGSQRWLDQIKTAIDALSDSALRAQVQKAFQNKMIDWQIYKWPK